MTSRKSEKSKSNAEKSASAMTLREWWDEVGTSNVLKVIAELKTSLSYMRLLRYRNKRPSYDLAKNIIESASRITPGFTPDLELMMLPIERKANYTPSIQPSAAFIRANGGVAA